jgi:hypothetical protein
MEPSPESPYSDRPEIGETYADQVRLIHFDGQTVRFEFAVSRPTLAGPDRASVELRPAVRLVLPPLAAVALHEQLARLIAALEQSGVIKRLAPVSVTRQ